MKSLYVCRKVKGMSLEKFGWNSYFESEFLRVCESGIEPARVASVGRERFTLWTESGEVEAAASGRLRHLSTDWPVTGDWVALEGRSRIASVLPRRSAFSRKEPGAAARPQVIAANVDVLLIVCGLDDDFNPRRIERYLLLAWEGGARPVIVLNKTDLCVDVAAAAQTVEALASGAPVLPICAREGHGLAALDVHLKTRQTAALVGSSGAGKSTLINRLLGTDYQAIQEVRACDSRGRHTTVVRELFLAPSGALVMDTPGLRELQLWAGPASVDAAFSDIGALAAHCRFRDCRHQGEPGCAVAEIDPNRLASYAKLNRELAHLDRRIDPRAAWEYKRRVKSIHRAMRRREKPDT